MADLKNTIEITIDTAPYKKELYLAYKKILNMIPTNTEEGKNQFKEYERKMNELKKDLIL